MICLYHGTSETNSNSIFVSGIIPNLKNNWDREYQQKSIDGFVYLTDDLIRAYYYATRTALKDNEYMLSIIEVEVEEENLYPDENLFTNSTDIDKYAVKNAQDIALFNKDKWETSLKEKNLVAHSGYIEPKNILKNRKIHLSGSPFYGFIKHFKEKTIDKFDIAIKVYHTVNEDGWIFNYFGSGVIDVEEIEIIPKSGGYIFSYKDREVEVIR